MALGAATLALIATGCGNEPAQGDGADSATPAEAEAPTEAAADAATTTEAAAETSINQWASLVAGQRQSVEDLNEKWDDAVCSATAIAVGDAPDCEAYLVSMDLTAQATTTVLGGAVNADSDTYLGDPPPEIADLYFETFDAADAVAVAYSDMEYQAATPMDVTRAWSDLLQTLAMWEPYL